MTVQPLFETTGERIGSMLVFEDITAEQRVRTTMARYMSKEVVDQLLTADESVLGGATQVVSILFSDIRGFTTLSEGLDARDTVNLLNDYFAEMVEIVIDHAGILDKYIGDAIMALFGAPFGKPDDADRALAVANDMMVALRSLNRRFQNQGRPTLKIGVGVATGDVVVGNIGSPLRMEYTVMGDRVNIASRLEGANKYYHTGILLDEATVKALKTQTLLREIDLLRVKGKDRPVAVYEALAYHDSLSFPSMIEVLAAFNQGLQEYRKGNWPAAIKPFKTALQLNPQDGPSAVYLERCRFYSKTPPPADWDGVWVMMDK
jgi:adenylate cyclase